MVTYVDLMQAWKRSEESNLKSFCSDLKLEEIPFSNLHVALDSTFLVGFQVGFEMFVRGGIVFVYEYVI